MAEAVILAYGSEEGRRVLEVQDAVLSWLEFEFVFEFESECE